MKLKHKTKDIFSEVIFLPFVHKAYILTVDKNIAGSCIIKASDNVKQGRFAAAAFSDYNALFAAFNIKGKILYDCKGFSGRNISLFYIFYPFSCPFYKWYCFLIQTMKFYYFLVLNFQQQ